MKPWNMVLPLMACGALLFTAPAVRADTITIAADVWCPYNCEPGSDMPGYGIEIAREILAKAGHTLEYKSMAWPRALDDCRKGNVQAVIGATQEEAPDFIFPEETIAVTDNSFLVRKGDSWRYDGIETLKTIKLGAIKGYAYGGDVGAYIQENEKDRKHLDLIGGNNALTQNIKKLLAGRVRTTVDSHPVLSYKLKQMGLSDRVEFAGSGDTSEIYIAFSPANPKSKSYATLLQKGIAAMREDGRLKAILSRYGVTDWKE